VGPGRSNPARLYHFNTARAVDVTGNGVLVTLSNILLRQANKTENPRAYLDDLITAQFTSISAQGGLITATSVNGKSLQLQIMPGTSARDVMVAAEMALSCLEAGLRSVPRQTYTLIR